VAPLSELVSIPRAELDALKAELKRLRRKVGRGVAKTLSADMLVLTDRGLDSAGFLQAVAATGAQFLARLTSTRLLPAAACLPDSTYLFRVGGLTGYGSAPDPSRSPDPPRKCGESGRCACCGAGSECRA
jgi:hypothetical protein